MKTVYAVLFLTVLSACGNPATTEQSSAKQTSATKNSIELEKPEHQSTTTTSNKVATDTTGLVVYITHEGNKYHTAECRYAKSSQAVRLSQAKADGKTACDICKPNAKTGEKQFRCSAKTKEGKQCQRMTTDARGKCFQHK
jgi:maltose-binding protein MalE